MIWFCVSIKIEFKMSKYTLYIGLFLILASYSPIQGQYRFEEYEKLTSEYSKDSIQTILMDAERLFSAKLNEFRSKRRKKELVVSKHASVAAFNHALWMAVNGNLSHSQKKNSAMFSGKSIKDRLLFVRTFQFESYGENIAYISFRTEEITEEKDAAEWIANKFYELWVTSSGHKSNMLDADFRSHGISFYYFEEQIYAANVFLSR